MGRGEHSKYLPYAFTEQGLAMLSGILHDQNDINESTRAQLDAISTALAELQAKKPLQRPHQAQML